MSGIKDAKTYRQQLRRQFIRQSSHLLAGSALLPHAVIAGQTSTLQPVDDRSNSTSNYRGISASGRTAPSFALGQFNQQHNSTLTSPFRGHGLAFHPAYPDSVVMVERRPGYRVSMVNLSTQSEYQLFESQSSHYLCGHACFSQDGKQLFCSQARHDNHHGSIAVFDVDSGRQVQQWDSHGIEPHELVLDPTGRKIYVANGGLIRAKDAQRTLLNRASMESSFVVLDAQTGALIDQLAVDLAHTSLRHLAVAEDQTVSLAMQYQAPSPSTDTPPHMTPMLAATYHPDRGIILLPAPDRVWELCQGYIGSTAICSSTKTAVFTSPRGNIAAFWHYPSQQLTSIYRLHDVCGVSVTPDQRYFVVTNSQGSIRYLNTRNLRENQHLRQKFDQQDWDNHLLMLPNISNRMST